MDPNQKPADVDLQCFRKRINLVSAGQGLNLSTLTLYVWYIIISLLISVKTRENWHRHDYSDSGGTSKVRYNVHENSKRFSRRLELTMCHYLFVQNQ